MNAAAERQPIKGDNDEPKKKGIIANLKEKLNDKEEQFEYISVLVRRLVVVWSGGIVTLNYIQIPGLTNGEKQDITFPASLLAGGLASFGLEKSGSKKGDGTYQVEEKDKPMTKAEMETAMATQSGTYQTIRIETPIKILGAQVVDQNPPAES